jgi:hypothetical protein
MGQDTQLVCHDCKITCDTGRNHNEASQMQSFLLAHGGHHITACNEYMADYYEIGADYQEVVYPVADSYKEAVYKWIDDE